MGLDRIRRFDYRWGVQGDAILSIVSAVVPAQKGHSGVVRSTGYRPAAASAPAGRPGGVHGCFAGRAPNCTCFS